MMVSYLFARKNSFEITWDPKTSIAIYNNIYSVIECWWGEKRVSGNVQRTQPNQAHALPALLPGGLQ